MPLVMVPNSLLQLLVVVPVLLLMLFFLFSLGVDGHE